MLYIGMPNRDEAAKVRRAVEQRGLTSHMNDTKWRALCTAIGQELPFPPPRRSSFFQKQLIQRRLKRLPHLGVIGRERLKRRWYLYRMAQGCTES